MNRLVAAALVAACLVLNFSSCSSVYNDAETNDSAGPGTNLRRQLDAPTTETIDGDALCSFYNAVTSGKAALINWCGTKTDGNYVNGPCSSTGDSAWTGVSCTDGRVTSLNLASKSIAGSLPSQLFSLIALVQLDLASNSIGGSLPSLAGLTNLQNILLNGNMLSGSIPSLVGLTNLVFLYLGSNSLSGSIPSFAGLVNLQRLSLSNNLLVGKLPNLVASLKSFAVDSNRLTGSLAPTSLANLPNLELLSLQNNNLTGQVPSSACGLPTSVSSINFLQNPLLTCYPACLSTKVSFQKDSSLSVCPTAETIDGDALCSFYNAVTTGKTALTNWCGVKSNRNYVNGPCSSTGGSAWTGVFCEDGRVISLYLGNKGLAGKLPSLSGLTSVRNVDLSANAFTGNIPSLFGLTNLETLNLGSNSLVGFIPVLAGLSKLRTLSLNNNQLLGPIPPLSGTALLALDLRNNALTGPIPSSICSLSSAIAVQVQSQAGSGLTCYPSCLGLFSRDVLTVCPTAETIDGNALCSFYNAVTSGKAALTNWCGTKSSANNYVNGPCTGTAGAWVGVTCTSGRVTSLNLASKSIAGSLPSQLFSLSGLTQLDLHANRLTGVIDSTICNFPATAQINFQGNSGLACYPSCLWSFPSFQKDATLRTCPLSMLFTATLSFTGITQSAVSSDTGTIRSALRTSLASVLGISTASISNAVWTFPASSSSPSTAVLQVQGTAADLGTDLSQITTILTSSSATNAIGSAVQQSSGLSITLASAGATIAPTVYYTHHTDSSCSSPVFSTRYARYADPAGVVQTMRPGFCVPIAGGLNAIFSCRLLPGGMKYSLTYLSFAASDPACLSAPVVPHATITEHDLVCNPYKTSGNRDAKYGGYAKIHCGTSLADTALLSRYSGVTAAATQESINYPTLFSDAGCLTSGSITSRTFFLHTCTPAGSHFHFKGAHGGSLHFNFVLDIVQRSGPMKIRMRKFSSADATCSSIMTGERIVAYPAVGTTAGTTAAGGGCKPDPLQPGLFFLNGQGTAPFINAVPPTPQPSPPPPPVVVVVGGGPT